MHTWGRLRAAAPAAPDRPFAGLGSKPFPSQKAVAFSIAGSGKHHVKFDNLSALVHAQTAPHRSTL